MKRQQILNAALELFVNGGFHGTSTAAIADKARVANGTLFHYFKTKEELIIVLYLEVKDNFIIQVTENYNKDFDLRGRLIHLIKGSLQWATEFPNEYRFIQQFVNSPYMHYLTGDQKLRYEQIFLDLCKEGVITNIFKDLPVELLQKMYFAQINGLIDYVFDKPAMVNDEDRMNRVMKSIWDSLCNKQE